MVFCEILFLSLLELGSASGSDGWYQDIEPGLETSAARKDRRGS